MKILFNCTNNALGGAVQNSANFIKMAIHDNNHEFLFLVSKEVEKVLLDWGMKGENIISFDRKNNLIFSADEILKIEKYFNPDLVYTMAGPTYIRFKKTHVMGISDGYITHAKFKNFKFNRNLKESIIMFLKTFIKGIIARKSANYFIFQTNTARDGFSKRYFLNKSFSLVVSNAVNEKFLNEEFNFSSEIRSEGEYKIICPSAYYSHKDIEILFKVANLIPNEINIKFITTINDKDYRKLSSKLKNKNKIINIGPYSYADALKVYQKGDAIILPSTLETFSTTYIEAIALKKPLIVANANFSREICGNYANYFELGDPFSLLNLLKAGSFKNVDSKLKVRNEILSKYGTQADRYRSLIAILETINR